MGAAALLTGKSSGGASRTIRRSLDSAPVSSGNIRRLGSQATDSPGAEESAKRIVNRATRPDNVNQNFNEEMTRIGSASKSYSETTQARDKVDLALDYSPFYNDRLQAGSNRRRATPGIVTQDYNSRPIVVPHPHGGRGMDLSKPSTRVRELEADAAENTNIARSRSKRKP